MAAVEPSGTLIYGHDKLGDRIGDFSFAGYKSGGVALPVVPTKIKLSPTGKDDTAALQKALDTIAAMPLVEGERGALELASGTFILSDTLRIETSGIVLRGVGPSTILKLSGAPKLAISLAGKLKIDSAGLSTPLTDTYVASGTNTIHLADATGLQAGDLLQITKPVTEEWVHFMGMDTMVRNGKQETWIKGDLKVLRRVASVSGKTVTLGDSAYGFLRRKAPDGSACDGFEGDRERTD